MIKLYQFPPFFGVPNASPFCVKAEILLKMSGLPYETVITPNPRKGPKGKLPAIKDKGRFIGDSELIRQYLEREYGVDFDKGLGARERAAAHAFARLLEERTYWAMIYNRWIEEDHWPIIRKAFFGGMPPVLRSVIPVVARKKTREYLDGHGIGRHDPAEVYAFGVADVQAVAAWLGDKPYFMGEAPSSADASVYALVENLIAPPFASPMKAEALKHANLVAYTERMRVRYFPREGAAIH